MEHAHVIETPEHIMTTNNAMESYDRTYDVQSANLTLGIRRRGLERYCDQTFIMHFCHHEVNLFVQISVYKDHLTVNTRYIQGDSLPANTIHSLFHVPSEHQLTHISRSREDRIIMSEAASLHRVSLDVLLRLKEIPATYFRILDKRIDRRLEALSHNAGSYCLQNLRDLADESARALLCLLV